MSTTTDFEVFLTAQCVRGSADYAAVLQLHRVMRAGPLDAKHGGAFTVLLTIDNVWLITGPHDGPRLILATGADRLAFVERLREIRRG